MYLVLSIGDFQQIALHSQSELVYVEVVNKSESQREI
jgi:hypothetical protein